MNSYYNGLLLSLKFHIQIIGSDTNSEYSILKHHKKRYHSYLDSIHLCTILCIGIMNLKALCHRFCKLDMIDFEVCRNYDNCNVSNNSQESLVLQNSRTYVLGFVFDVHNNRYKCSRIPKKRNDTHPNHHLYMGLTQL